MLVFVIPLKSAAVAISWERVTHLLERTVRSACAQDCPDFRVIVVCHERPELAFDDPRLELLATGERRPVNTSPAELRKDKRRKVVAGARRALAHAPSHVMPLDADDLVSRRLAGHVARHSGAPGWYIPRGYIYQEGRGTVHVERWRFHRWCGSSLVLAPELLELPVAEPADDWRDPHDRPLDDFRRAGTPLAPLPFPGAVYVVSHGDWFRDYAPRLWPLNRVAHGARQLLFLRRVSDRMREEFGLRFLAE